MTEQESYDFDTESCGSGIEILEKIRVEDPETIRHITRLLKIVKKDALISNGGRVFIENIMKDPRILANLVITIGSNRKIRLSGETQRKINEMVALLKTEMIQNGVRTSVLNGLAMSEKGQNSSGDVIFRRIVQIGSIAALIALIVRDYVL